ncbi:MAG: M28 family peptidase, partial [Cyclobacteriaceae bacterium]
GNNDVNKTNLSFIGNGQDSVTQKMNLKDKAVLVVSNNRVSEIPISELLGRGVKLILVCNADSDNAFTDFKKAVNQSQSSTRLSLTKPVEQGDLESVVFISPSAAANLTGIPYSRLRTIATEKGQPDAIEKIEAHTITYRLQNDIEEVVADNVLGYLEGSDKKDELVVITAHYDHIGKRATGSGDLINNGADDDGSGTVAVMELARVFAEAKASGNGPLRSMLFMTVTGEEIGLLGSQYYTDYPVFPLSKTVVDLNIDMIGRSDAEHKDNADYVYVIGSDKLSSELHQISESINSTHTKLAFDYTYNDVNHPTNLYKRSDHWNFAKHDIPIIFYFDGIHEDYHKPSDEVDKIDFDILRKRTQLIFYTAWQLAYRKDRIKNDKE